ncbi:MAG: 4-hydroxy-tetrahydrodipicolinate synthase [Gammaproteobacteria bacterium]
MLNGSITALITPMKTNGHIDDDALNRLIDWQIEQNTDGLVIIGSTGESSTLTADEQEKIITMTVERVAKRIPVVVGTGSNSTQIAIEKTKKAKALGADAVLLVTPYYNKPLSHGLYQHFMAIANAVDIPQILYNVPGRSIIDMDNETIITLSQHDNIIGVKEASGDISRIKPILEKSATDFKVWSGDDITALECIQAGGHGVISVVSNMIPKQMHDLCALALKGNMEEAKQLNQSLLPLYEMSCLETNPIPIKWAMYEMGLIDAGIRLPLTPLSAPLREKVHNLLKEQGQLS